jgi:selenocysteine lyase/cysteine desulfurase
LFGQLIGASPEDIAIVPSTAYAISFAANFLRLHASSSRKDIVILRGQYLSNVLPWERLISVGEASFKIVERPKSGDWTSAVLASIAENTFITALPNCLW